MLHTPRDFMHQVQCNNNARYLYLQSQFHWSNARWKKEKRLSHRPILTLSPLHYGDFSDVINLDHCNLFLLGLHYYSTLGVLSDILLLHDLSWTFSALEDTFMVGLDSLCSCHLFPSKSDFVSQILPIDPFGIQGVGGGGYKGNWQRNYSSPVPL